MKINGTIFSKPQQDQLKTLKFEDGQIVEMTEEEKAQSYNTHI